MNVYLPPYRNGEIHKYNMKVNVYIYTHIYVSLFIALFCAYVAFQCIRLLMGAPVYTVRGECSLAYCRLPSPQSFSEVKQHSVGLHVHTCADSSLHTDYICTCKHVYICVYTFLFPYRSSCSGFRLLGPRPPAVSHTSPGRVQEPQGRSHLSGAQIGAADCTNYLQCSLFLALDQRV